ncbi:MAG: S8 family serine peptidase [Lachnospiraceae bacterium]|nr:S8 family serine peptidase [Lachnospiraceae bacterium]
MPENQKAENLLNLSLDATQEERMASPVLRAGTDRDNEQWEVIVKFHGDISGISGGDIHVEILSAGYAIITLPKRYIEALAALEEIEFVEKPKRLYANDAAGNFASCLYRGTGLGNRYRGRGICIAVIDSGLSFELPAFRNGDGTTRVLYYYDQTQNREYTKEELDAILLNDNTGENGTEGENGSEAMRPSPDNSGHGTAVAAIAAGNGRRADGSVDVNLIGVAPEASLLIVKLDTGANSSFPLTTSLMRAMDYAVNKGVEIQMPLAVNLSFGNTYGAHDGTALIERFINNMAEIGRTVVCVGSGNEGAAGGHTAGVIGQGERERVIEFTIGSYEREFNLQLWLNFVDSYEILLQSPAGDSFSFHSYTDMGRTIRRNLAETSLLFYVGAPQPYSVNQEVFLDFIPDNTYVNQGVWRMILRPTRLVSGNYSLYMPSSQIKGQDTRFLRPVPEQTLTIPSTAERVITVGAYNPVYEAYADFSGRGFVTRLSEGYINMVKPEIAAPGVGILSENAYGIQRLDGTSYATPFATGGAALLMERAILQGEDPYLYGEKMKAWLCRHAKSLSGTGELPNDKTGWGGLCIADN